MCESSAYMQKDGEQEELILEDVVMLRPDDGRIILTNILGDKKELAAEIDSVESLVILGGNPVYDAPADLKFDDLLAREALTSVHIASHRDETSALCSWHAPLAHELEAWGDQQSLNGSYSVQQPLIAPLHGSRSEVDVLSRIILLLYVE